MSREHWLVQFERVEHCHNIVAETVSRIIGGRKTGCTETASRNAVNMVGCRELRCEIVKYVRSVPTPGEEDDGPANPSPIEHL
jgi:hypothetical protein